MNTHSLSLSLSHYLIILSLSPEEVKRALMGLGGGKLVKVLEFSSKKLEMDTVVSFNAGFASKKLKIPVPLPKVVVCLFVSFYSMRACVLTPTSCRSRRTTRVKVVDWSRKTETTSVMRPLYAL